MKLSKKLVMTLISIFCLFAIFSIVTSLIVVAQEGKKANYHALVKTGILSTKVNNLAQPVMSAVQNELQQLYTVEHQLYLDSRKMNEQVMAFEGELYVHSSIVEELGGEVIFTPFLETVLISIDDVDFSIPIITPTDTTPIFSYQSNTEQNDRYQVLLVESSLYVPLPFVKNELNYSVHELNDQIRILTEKDKDKDLPLDIPLINQMDAPRLYNGCEVTSLAMILQYHEMDVTKNELADEIATVPLIDENGYKGHPNDGFVGDMENGPGLSVYHRPMLELAREYVGDRAVDLTGSNPEILYDYLDRGLPIWIITTTSLAPVNNFQSWKTETETLDVTFNVHSVAVTGYNEDYVFVNDPYGIKNRMVDREEFEKSWVQMGRQAIVILD